jgi:hypothetical protein
VAVRFSSPIHTLVVAHSPTPSKHSTAALSNGDGKKADAACDWWCSVNSNLGSSRIDSPAKTANSFFYVAFKYNFSFNQTGIAALKDLIPLGA